jgi:hypothetical protein
MTKSRIIIDDRSISIFNLRYLDFESSGIVFLVYPITVTDKLYLGNLSNVNLKLPSISAFNPVEVPGKNTVANESGSAVVKSIILPSMIICFVDDLNAGWFCTIVSLTWVESFVITDSESILLMSFVWPIKLFIAQINRNKVSKKGFLSCLTSKLNVRVKCIVGCS